MNLARDTQTHEWPRRMSGVIIQRGDRIGLSTWGAFLFSTPFVGMGIFIVMIGTGLFEVDPSEVHAPYWLLTLIGAMFGFAGVVVWGMGVRQMIAERRRSAMMASHQNTALIDYQWDPYGYTPSRWAPVRQGAIGAFFFTGFTVMISYFIFPEPMGWVHLVAGIFILATLFIWYDTILKIMRAVKFGNSRIIFDSFPYDPDKPVLIRWVPPPGLTSANKGSFTLRCVEEYYETSGTGSNRSSVLVHNELWGDTWLLDHPEAIPQGREIEIRYEIPNGLPSTVLNSKRPVFWEFEVNLSMAGPDFVQTYLVPVYSS